MKRAFIMLIITVICTGSYGQRKTRVSGYGAAFAELNHVGGDASLGLGGYGGVLLNSKYLIGIAGHNVMFRKASNGVNQSYQYNAYGPYFEYHLKPENPVHLVAGIMTGAGWIQQKQSTEKEIRYKKIGDWHYSISPNIGLSVDITKFMRVHSRVSYNFTGSTGTTLIKKSDIQGIGGSIALVFGSF